jgi:PadR family transcriptional regulator PadR
MRQTLGELEQTVLLAILRLGDGAYGVSIRREIGLCTYRNVAPGALYITLDRLEKKALVEVRDGDPTPERGGRAKRYYKLTREGRGLLIDAQRGFKCLMDGLEIIHELYGVTNA